MIVLLLAGFYVLVNIIADVVALLATPRRRSARVVHGHRIRRHSGRATGAAPPRMGGHPPPGRVAAERQVRPGGTGVHCGRRRHRALRGPPWPRPASSPRSPALPARPSLGGDVLGRDVLSRVLDGGWLLLAMAAAATALGVALGTASGITAGYLQGRPDGIIMRTVNVLLAFPQLVFALLLVSILGPTVWLTVLAVGLSHAPQVARVMRAATLDVSERDFVKATELLGVKRGRIMAEEILPNLVSPLMVEIGLRLTYSIVIIAGLSFLGFGQPPPAPNWGIMINENRQGLVSTRGRWRPPS